MAGDIAKILGANVHKDGYYEGPGIAVTWAIGHLCCLLEPHDYKQEWKRWYLSSLPMLPERYDIKIIEQSRYKQQFNTIKYLISQADEIVNCGDAGQEGELIQRWIMKMAGVSCPVSRLWISSLTDESIREGFRNLKPQKEYDSLFYAGLSRAIGDWILGMNATRLYTLKYSRPGTVLSIGRVQTPTLAILVQRQKEIENFVPKDSWELHTLYRDVDFTYTGDRFDKEEKGLESVSEIEPLPFIIDGSSKKKGREAPPRLFDLTSLQVECNKKFGWSAEQTLQLIQSLYEKKLTTYPRVDTTYLTDDIYPKVAPTLRALTAYARFTEPVLAKPIPKTKKVFDNAKVTDHHAIIPTGQSPSGLEGDEKKMFHLVALRFIAAFYPDCVFENTVVEGHAGDYAFKTTGKVIIEQGWRVLYPSKADRDSNSEDADDDRTLPVFSKGESGKHVPSLVKKTSQPPKYYTEGTLLRAMETAGRNIDDETLREAMKENGIGRPSTRAAIIETLFKRHYIVRERKNLIPTKAGIDLIDTIHEELLKSPKLTGIWENKLRRIERGDYSASSFIKEISELIRTVVHNVMNESTTQKIITEPEKQETKEKPEKTKSVRITKLEQVKCPVCGEGHLLKGRSAFGCSRYKDGCSFRLSFEECPEDTKPGVINRKINGKK